VVHGDEEVGLLLVGDVGTPAHRHVFVVGAGHDHFHIGIGGTDLLCKGQGDAQGVRLLVNFLVAADGAGVLPAVAGVDDNRGEAEMFIRPGGCRKKHGQDNADCAFQK
jgi:hypothetical protein